MFFVVYCRLVLGLVAGMEDGYILSNMLKEVCICAHLTMVLGIDSE